MTTPLEDSRAFKTIDLGHETDTTLARVSAGVISIAGVTLDTTASVTKVGTPANNQVGVWTGDGTIEGDADLTFDGDNLYVGTGINLGHASDTTITRSAAGIIEVEGKVVNPMTTEGDMIYGGASGTGMRLAAGADTTILVGGGAGAPVWTTATGTGAPVRGTSPQISAIELSHATENTLTASSGVLSIEGNAVYMATGTDVAITDGGTGASTAAAGFDALSPMTTVGDVVYGGASGTGTRLAAGDEGDTLTAHGAAAPTWEAYAPHGEMSFYSSGTTQTVTITDEYIAIASEYSTGLMSGFTFVAGSSGAGTTSTAAAGAAINIADNAHGLVSGDYVNVQSANHNGTSVVTYVDDNNFTVAIAYVGDEAIDWQQGDYLLAGANSGGRYLLSTSITGKAGATAKEFKFEAVQNATHIDKSAFNITVSGTDHQSGASFCLITVTAADRFWMQFKNETDTQDLVYQHANLNLVKI